MDGPISDTYGNDLRAVGNAALTNFVLLRALLYVWPQAIFAQGQSDSLLVARIVAANEVADWAGRMLRTKFPQANVFGA
jgi:hypothetical protein